MSWVRNLGKKLNAARAIGQKVTHTVATIGRKGGAILHRVADAASVVPGLGAASGIIDQAARVAEGVGLVAHAAEGAIAADNLKSAVANGGLAYAHGKALKRTLEKKPAATPA